MQLYFKLTFFIFIRNQTSTQYWKYHKWIQTSSHVQTVNVHFLSNNCSICTRQFMSASAVLLVISVTGSSSPNTIWENIYKPTQIANRTLVSSVINSSLESHCCTDMRKFMWMHRNIYVPSVTELSWRKRMWKRMHRNIIKRGRIRVGFVEKDSFLNRWVLIELLVNVEIVFKEINGGLMKRRIFVCLSLLE